MSDPVILLLVLVAGFFTGMLSGVFGVGGAVISTPAILALGATPLQAVGSTLPSIIPSSIAGTLRYTREGLVRRRVVLFTGLAGATFAALGAIASAAIPGRGHVQMVLTACLMAFTAYRTGTGGRQPPSLDEHGQPHLNLGAGLLIIIGVLAGMLSGFLGVGGGILMVPAFTALVGLDLKEAIGTSLACVGIIAIPGTITHQLLGNVSWFYAVPLMIGAIPGARVGVHLAIKASDRHLRIVVASVLGTIAVIYGAAELIALIG
jgi:Predicted permeases